MKFKAKWLFLIMMPAAGLTAGDKADFGRFFTDATMRLDYCHTGTDKEEIYSLDEVWKEPLWPGSRTNLIDALGFGKYRVEVFDTLTNQLIFSRGFCSIFGEWQTTDEAIKGIRRTFSESVRFPWPLAPVRIVLSTRNRANEFEPKWTLVVDPSDKNLRRDEAFATVPIETLIKNGEPEDKVDIVILPDGYRKEEMDRFKKDAVRLLKVLFSDEPYRSRKTAFNVWTVELPSNESGIDNPRSDVYRDNAFGSSFNTFTSDRYVLAFDNKTIRKAAARVPYDQIILLVNDKKYGGGGIYNLYATCAAGNRWAEYVFTHEFGHAFAGLGDEYYTSDVAYSEFYPAGVEPWDPNLTVCTDSAALKWRDLVGPGVPIPTPWDKETFDAHQAEYGKNRSAIEKLHAPQARVDSLVAANDIWVRDFLATRAHSNDTGAFEGGGYASKGIFRPFTDCRMFTRGHAPFCPVCRRAIERVIDAETR